MFVDISQCYLMICDGTLRLNTRQDKSHSWQVNYNSSQSPSTLHKARQVNHNSSQSLALSTLHGVGRKIPTVEIAMCHIWQYTIYGNICTWQYMYTGFPTHSQRMCLGIKILKILFHPLSWRSGADGAADLRLFEDHLFQSVCKSASIVGGNPLRVRKYNTFATVVVYLQICENSFDKIILVLSRASKSCGFDMTADSQWDTTILFLLFRSSRENTKHYIQGVFFLHWYPPKKLKYGKPRLDESQRRRSAKIHLT